MQGDLEGITLILQGYMSNVNARALITRSLQEKGLSPTRVTRAELTACRQSLRRGIELFVPPAVRSEALERLNQFFGRRESPGAVRVQIESERDISTARAEARRMCEKVGANAFAMQKVTTIVSELARNIVLYAAKGAVELEHSEQPLSVRGRVRISAVDDGPGIPNLETILSGRYRSRTGLGKGLLGTKRLAEDFRVDTSRGGTSVTAEVAL